MDDELLTGAAALIGVVLAGVDERVADALAVDRDRRLVGVLLDDREQVVEQPCSKSLSSTGGSATAAHRTGVPASAEPPAAPGRREQRRREHGAVPSAAWRPAQFARLGFDPLRNR